jgi:hypothetical protein
MNSIVMKTKNAARTVGVEVSDLIYQCPMKCEGDKTYNRPGNCPVCNMKLMPISNIAHDHH